MSTAAQRDLAAEFPPTTYLRSKESRSPQMVEVQVAESDVLYATNMLTDAVVQISVHEIDRWETVTPLTKEDPPS